MLSKIEKVKSMQAKGVWPSRVIKGDCKEMVVKCANQMAAGLRAAQVHSWISATLLQHTYTGCRTRCPTALEQAIPRS